MKRLMGVIVWVALLAVTTGCETSSAIVTDLNESEANNIIVFLSGYGIHATKVAKAAGGMGGGAKTESMWAIHVPQAQAIEALSILNRNGLPRRPAPSLLTIFQKSGLVSSAQEEQIRYQEGLSTQIANTIRQIDGVIDATVQISFPSVEGGDTPEEKIRASVYVKHSGILDDPNTQLLTKIKRLVSGSVAGLNLDAVTVVTDRARFTEIGMESPAGYEDGIPFTRVWSVSVANESVGAFRTIFFSLCVIIFFLAAFVAWVLWKVFPLISASGGLAGLFSSLKPIHTDDDQLPPAETGGVS